MSETLHAELSEIIVNLERIHQFLSEDLFTLQLLCETHLRAGDVQQAGDYLVRLAEKATEQENPAMAAYAAAQISSGNFKDRNFDHLTDALQSIAGNYEQHHDAPPSSSRADVYAEICLAYKLMESKEINEGEYAGIAYELSSMAAKGAQSSITVQHALKHRSPADMDNVLAAMVTDSRLPLINLGHFELDGEALASLPHEYMSERGVLVFDRMGKNAMVGVLNPYDEGVRLEVKERLKAPCHFFLIRASEFDEVLEKQLAAQSAELS